jgi:hypothetical protein
MWRASRIDEHRREGAKSVKEPCECAEFRSKYASINNFKEILV